MEANHCKSFARTSMEPNFHALCILIGEFWIFNGLDRRLIFMKLNKSLFFRTFFVSSYYCIVHFHLFFGNKNENFSLK